MSLALILGRCDSLRAEVYLRASLPEDVDARDVVVTGTLSGPECRRAITLPVTAKFSTLPSLGSNGEASSVVARAILTEPSYWTPDVPSLYRLAATLTVGGRDVCSWRRTVGLRRFGVRGRSLWLDGRRFVPRGLALPEAAIDIDQFREASIAAVVADPSESFLDRCDADGVPVIGVLAEACGAPLDGAAAAERLARWAWHPALLMAVVPVGAAAGEIDRIAMLLDTRGTLLLAQEVDGARSPPEITSECDALVMSLAQDALPHAGWRMAPSVPVVARRRDARAYLGTNASRSPCDALQAALAHWRSDETVGTASWDWAGFFGDGPMQRP